MARQALPALGPALGQALGPALPSLQPLGPARPLGPALPVLRPLHASEYYPPSLVPFLGLCFFLFSGKLVSDNFRNWLSFLLIVVALMGGLEPSFSR